jgi:hypothetical protein
MCTVIAGAGRMTARKSWLCFGCTLWYPAAVRLRRVTFNRWATFRMVSLCPTCRAAWASREGRDEIPAGDLRGEDPDAWERARGEIGAPMGTNGGER